MELCGSTRRNKETLCARRKEFDRRAGRELGRVEPRSELRAGTQEQRTARKRSERARRARCAEDWTHDRKRLGRRLSWQRQRDSRLKSSTRHGNKDRSAGRSRACSWRAATVRKRMDAEHRDLTRVRYKSRAGAVEGIKIGWKNLAKESNVDKG